MIKSLKPRLYQETILSTCVQKNSLVVLPTGMGKSIIFVMLAAHRLKQFPDSKVLILAPTKPLCEQHRKTLLRFLDLVDEEVVLFTGNVSPDKRKKLWDKARVIVSTPQSIENDAISRRIKLEEISLLTVDEAHRAVKDYAYVWIAKQYMKTAKFPRILGLTASPGSDLATITEVCENLNVEDIEVRTDEDPDVKPYIQDVELVWEKVSFPDSLKEVHKSLTECYQSKLKDMTNYGYVSTEQISQASKKELLGIQAGLHSEIAKGNKDFEILKTVSLAAEAMKIQHAIELVETQGVAPLYKYLKGLESQARTSKTKAVKNLVMDINFRMSLVRVTKLIEEGVEHPKLARLKEVLVQELDREKDAKVIIFNQYRDTAVKIKEEINKESNVNAEIFVGQAKKGETGLSQKEQIAMLDRYREGEFNTIIMTSVGEEGLDIPKVDSVIFYEPIPSAIRHIQRRGRTGRQDKGRVLILMTSGTRDEGYRWSAHHKEKRMYRTLETLKTRLAGVFTKNNTMTLSNYIPEEERVKIIVDHREKGSGVIRELIDKGAEIDLQQLENADYVLSKRVGVEFKTVEDFVNSIIDGRLLNQIKDLKGRYERPIVLVEGDKDIYSVRSIHPNAIRGMLATITVSYGIPVLYTKNYGETAALMHVIAKREQESGGSDFSPHASRKPMTLKEQQEYVVSSMPLVGMSLARGLLEKFGSVKGIVNADKEELMNVEKVGMKKAEELRKVLDATYDKEL